MINYKQISRLIEKETERVFRGRNSFDVESAIDTFWQTLNYPLHKPELRLDGLEERVPNALDKILNEGLRKVDNIAYFIEFAKVEPYLRKVLYITNPDKFNELTERKAGLGGYINALRLNPGRINFENDRIEELLRNENFGEHLFRVYHIRNVESHQCEAWSSRELYENIESVLVIYLYTTHKYIDKLKPIVHSVNQSINFDEYLGTVKSNFQNRIGKFIHLKGEENIQLTQGHVVENINNEEEIGNERKGTVDDLRKRKVPEQRMIIWGDAGMGKTITLEYLSYIDALEALKNNQSNIPVYLPLGLLTDRTISIKQSISNKIKVDLNTLEKLLSTGRINLFLDGINEIPKGDNNALKTLRIRQIEDLLKEYKNCFIIISNRPEEINTFRGIPVFFLQKMDREQIESFLTKNTDGNQKISNSILDAINENNRLEKIIRTPLMLSRLIEIVKSEGEIPESEGEIIGRFIHSLYRREQYEKRDANFNTIIIHRLLRHLGHESLEKKDTNSGMTEDEVLNYFVECKSKYGFNIDTAYVLAISNQLGILEEQDHQYTFAHQAYQDYYYAQEELAIP